MLSTLLALLLSAPFDDPVRATDEATCAWAKVAPTIDGKLDDEAWKEATRIDRFPATWIGKPSSGSTVARLAWDGEALYFCAEMIDREIRSSGEKRNDKLWNGDVFELFFKPETEKPAYYEFQVNPKSVILELAFPRRDHPFAELAARPPLGMVAVARVVGTLNTPGDEDLSWLVEGKIPWSVFEPSGGKPRPGDTWRFALCRYDYGKEGTKPVLTSSAPLTRPSFHRYEDYGKLRFARASNQADDKPGRTESP